MSEISHCASGSVVPAIAMSSGDVSTPVTQAPCPDRYSAIGEPDPQPMSKTEAEGGRRSRNGSSQTRSQSDVPRWPTHVSAWVWYSSIIRSASFVMFWPMRLDFGTGQRVRETSPLPTDRNAPLRPGGKREDQIFPSSFICLRCAMISFCTKSRKAAMRCEWRSSSG